MRNEFQALFNHLIWTITQFHFLYKMSATALPLGTEISSISQDYEKVLLLDDLASKEIDALIREDLSTFLSEEPLRGIEKKLSYANIQLLFLRIHCAIDFLDNFCSTIEHNRHALSLKSGMNEAEVLLWLLTTLWHHRKEKYLPLFLLGVYNFPSKYFRDSYSDEDYDNLFS